MLISLDELFKKYNIKFSGILHVGAHECEEIIYYEKYLPRNKILWIDALPEKVKLSKEKYENILIENEVVSDKIEIVKFNISNNGQSSSIFEFGLHSNYYPSIKYIESYNVKTNLLKNVISKYSHINFNFINLDIQGAELKALKGMEDYLHNIDYIYTEVNKDYVYKDCALINEIDKYLEKFNFYRVETVWVGEQNWGDAFYIKKSYSIDNKTVLKLMNDIGTNINPDKKKVIFIPTGRLGNGLFRYLACILYAMKYDLEYIVEDIECPTIEEYKFYKGVDHIGDDMLYLNNTSINDLKRYVNNNNDAKGFNTLGYVKEKININKLKSNDYINSNNGHGLFVKNIINIDEDDFIKLYLNDSNNLSNFNIKMSGYFQQDTIFLDKKKEILDFIDKNKNKKNHYIKTATYNRKLSDNNKIFMIKDILEDIELDKSMIYDIAIHLRLGDFNGTDDFIEYEYLEKLFNTIDFSNKRNVIVMEKISNVEDLIFVNKCVEWFKNRNIPISFESNDVITDFNIMKNAKTLICSMSTLVWCAAYFSKNIETCYMPNYNFDHLNRKTSFKTPIKNTILYDVKTTI